MVAVDQGTKNVGIAFEDRFFTITKEGYGKPGLIDLAKRVVDIIKNEDLVILEEYAHGGMFNKEEAEMVGMLFLLLQEYHPKICMLPITLIKKTVTGDGRAKKSKVMKAVKGIYNIESVISHECDALAFLYTYKNIDCSKYCFNL